MAGESDGLEGVNIEDAFAGVGEGGDGIVETLLGGGGGGQCSFVGGLELLGEPIYISPAFWELLSWVGMLVVAGAYLWVATQLGS